MNLLALDLEQRILSKQAAATKQNSLTQAIFHPNQTTGLKVRVV